MNTTFVFPPPRQTAPRQQNRIKPSGDDTNQEGGSRNSNALRASVFDAAMELGFGNSSVVAGWMFDNAVDEEDESEGQQTSASASNATSSSSPFPQRNGSTPTPGGPGVHFAPQSTVHVPVGEDPQATKPIVFRTSSGPGVALGSGKSTATGLPVAFPEGMPPPPPLSNAGVVFPIKAKSSKEDGKKLKKKKSGNDGYESDAGYMSEGGSKKKDKKKKDKKKEAEAEHEDSSMLSPSGEPGERKRKKSFVEAMRSSTKKKDKEKSKDKDKEADGGYETDGGTKKPKRSFFKLSGKSSKGDLAASSSRQEEIPSLPTLGLPIHERFAKTLPSGNASFSSSVAESTVTSTSNASTSTLPTMAPLPAMSFQPFGSSAPDSSPVESPTSQFPSPSALSNPNLDLGLSKSRDSQVSTGSSSSAGSASRAAPSSRTSHSSGHKGQDVNGSPPMPPPPPPPILNVDPIRSISPAFSTTSAASLRSPPDLATLKPVSSPLARTASPIPILPTTSLPDEIPQQSVLGQSSSRPPPVSLPPVTPLNLDKGKGGLRLKPSLERLNLLGRNKAKERTFQKDKDEHSFTETLLVPGQTSSALPSPLSPASPYVLITPVQTSPATSDTSPQSQLPTQPLPSPAQYGLPNSPLPPPRSTSPLPGPRNARPLSPPDGRTQPPPMPVPRTFISVPNTAVSSPVTSPSGGPVSAGLAIPRSRPANLNLSPDEDNKLGPGSGRPSPLTSPNVLAYYDIPPPSPPPSGPLPIPPRELPGGSSMDNARSPSPIPVGRRARSPIPPMPAARSGSGSPPIANAVPAQFPTPAQLRQRMMERGMRPPPPSALPQQPSHGAGAGSLSGIPIQRGRESPFPSRRLATVPFAGEAGGYQGSGSDYAASRYQNDATPPLATPKKSKDKRRARFAEDPVTSGGSAEGGEQSGKRRSWIDFNDDFHGRSRSSEDSNDIEIRVSTSEDEDGVSGEGTQESWMSQQANYGAMDPEDGSFREVIDRFSTQIEGSEESVYTGRALSRSQSSEALRATGSRPQPNAEYAWDDKMTVGDRTSRWSGSIYSRISIMDEEESTTTRDRFVKRVEAMLAASDSPREGTQPSDPEVGGMTGVGARGIARGMGVFVPPPVPRIPDMYVNANSGRVQNPPAAGASGNATSVPAGRNWNKF